MKKIAFTLTLWLVLTLAGFSDTLTPAVYINGQGALPAGAVMVDDNGACWVNANYLPLTQDESSRLSASSLNYQEYYQGVNFLNLTAVAAFLGWNFSQDGSGIKVYTSSYLAPAQAPAPQATPQAADAPEQTSTTVNINDQPSTAEVVGQLAADTLPMIYYMNNDDYVGGVPVGGNTYNYNQYNHYGPNNWDPHNDPNWNNHGIPPAPDRNPNLVYQPNPDSGRHFDDPHPDFGGYHGGGGFHGGFRR